MSNLPILLFDGSCGLCSMAVRFVLRHDRRAEFRFASLSSPTGRSLLEQHGVDPAIDTLVLIDGESAFIRTAALLAIVRRLGGAWHLLRVGALVPRPVRDAVYDAIARRRQGVTRRFGLECEVPTPAQRPQFLE